MSLSPQSTRFLFAAVYAAAALVLLDQTAELAASLYPFSYGTLEWRFGAFGLLVGRTTTAVLVDVLVFLAAIGMGHRRFLKVWGIFHFVVAAMLIGTSAIFSLDFLELRRRVRPEAADTMLLASARAGVVVLVALVYCVWVGIRALQSTPKPVAARRSDGPLLTQRQSS